MTDTEGMGEGVAKDSIASTPTISGSGNCPGVAAVLDSLGALV